MTNLLGAAETFETIGFAVLAVLGIMVMITVHEFGHYIVGKIFGFKINEFAIGMGPAVFKKTKKDGEIFSVRALPLGGYCAFEGEDADNPSENAFNNKAPWKRILVLASGAFMNYLLALLIIIVSMNVYGVSTMGVAVMRNFPAEEESLKGGDYILSVNSGGKDTGIYLATDLISALNHSSAGEVVYLDIIREENGESVNKTVAVRLLKDVECKNSTEIDKVYDALGVGSAMRIAVRGNDSGTFQTGDYIIKYNGAEKYEDCDFIFDAEDFRKALYDKEVGDSVGFYVSRNSERVLLTAILSESWKNVDKEDAGAVLDYFNISSYEYSYYTQAAYRKVGFLRSIPRSFGYSVKIGGTILKTLGELITGRLGLNAVGGTVTTIVTTTKIMRYGLVYALEIFSFIGVNLAVFNLLPIPALDGSRIVFCIIEWIRKKPLNRKVEGIIHAIGFAFILGFAVLVDLLQFV